ncbi:MAG: hypothetical protein KIT73_20160, partial [Burkholderiales bacterium]|nr:hypothetical protein [Burkholderiales bacterium]
PLARWLRDDLADRFDGLGVRLAAATDGQLSATAIDQLSRTYRGGQESLAEQVLQLIVLDESLRQLIALREVLADG